MSRKVTRRFGFPFRGYFSAINKLLVPLDGISGESHDLVLDPSEGKWIRRPGTALAGQFNDGGTINNIFESAYASLVSRRAMELSSADLTDGYPSLMALFSSDAGDGLVYFMSTNQITIANCSVVGGTNTITTTGSFIDLTPGCLFAGLGFPGGGQVLEVGSTTSLTVSKNAPANAGPANVVFGDNSANPNGMHRSIFHRWSTTHYPSAIAGTRNMKMVPMVGTANRCKSAAERGRVARGSRNMIEVGSQLLLPNYGTYPMKWNKRFNNLSASGSVKERFFPWGHIPPLHAPTIAHGSPAVGSPIQWKSGDTFFVSMMFRYRDGSFSRPFIPSIGPRFGNIVDKNVNGGFAGFVTLTQDCSDILWDNISAGQDGVDEVWLLRSTKTTDGTLPPLVDEDGNLNLGLTAVLKNNLRRNYTDPNGHDSSLRFDPLAIRIDSVWPPPSRYVWTGDHRVWGGYTQRHPGAILLSPRQNDDDDTGDTIGWEASLSGGVLTLQRADTAANRTYTCDSTKTLQQLVDDINTGSFATSTGLSPGLWWAGLVPGADPNITCDYLTVTTGIDAGDSATGFLRAFSNAWPILLIMNSTYQALFPAQKRRFWFTKGGPGIAPNADVVGVDNFRTAPEEWGYFIGGAPLLDGQIVCFSKAIGICRNTKGGKTGLDEDYRLEDLNANRGCLVDSSIVSGDGWVGYLTNDGYVVTDGTREEIISGAVYNASRKSGNWSGSSLILMLNARSLDNDLGALRFHASVMTGKLYIHLWADEIVGGSTLLIYDFSAGVGSSGLAEVLRPDGQPWGWSAPNQLTRPGTLLNAGAMAEVYRQNGVVKYLASPASALLKQLEVGGYDNGLLVSGSITATTSVTPGQEKILTRTNGTFDEVSVGAILTGTNIPRGTVVLARMVDLTKLTMSVNATGAGTNSVTIVGTEVQPEGFCAMDIGGTTDKKSVQHVTFFYSKFLAGVSIKVSRDQSRATQRTIALPATPPGSEFSRDVVEMPQALRAPGDVLEIVFADDGSGLNTEPMFWGADAELEILDSPR